jgi:hypothetical protein
MSEERGIVDTDRHDAAATPQLLPPVALPAPPLASARSLLIVAGFAIAVGTAAAATYYGQSPRVSGDVGVHSRAGPVPVDTSSMNGAFVLMDKELAAERPHLVRTLAMPERERQRVTEALREGRLRIAAVTLWDSFDQDADIVEITAGGFSQHLTITHVEKTYFVPVVPGGTVRIAAIKDGGGGGVTLGVRTLLGKLPLPPLAPGQFVEVPAL